MQIPQRLSTFAMIPNRGVCIICTTTNVRTSNLVLSLVLSRVSCAVMQLRSVAYIDAAGGGRILVNRTLNICR